MRVALLFFFLFALFSSKAAEEFAPGSFSSWGVSSANKKSNINIKKAWGKFKSRKKVVVAVIDTGVDPHHPYLKDNIHVFDKRFGDNNYGVDFSKANKSPLKPMDDHGHGSHIFGIIKSVLPSVRILVLKYYNAKASGQENLNSTIKALRYAVDKNVDIINYSGGGPEASEEELHILKRAEKKGILVVAAAGNESSNIDFQANAYYPASYNLSNIIAVTAHDQGAILISSANWGPKRVMVSAPGARIKSALPRGRAGFLTGTSQATAFVSGVSALLLSQYPSLKAQNIKKIITSSAKKELSLIGKCSSQGRLDGHQAQVRSERHLASKKRKNRKTAGKKTISR